MSAPGSSQSESVKDHNDNEFIKSIIDCTCKECKKIGEKKMSDSLTGAEIVTYLTHNRVDKDDTVKACLLLGSKVRFLS